MTFLSFKKLCNIVESPLVIPEFLYHATYKPLLKNIQKNGLGQWKRKNWEDSQKGVVYLAYEPEQAESYAESSDLVPENWLDRIVILQIKTSGLNQDLFRIDQNNQDESTLEYHGIIPIENIQILQTPDAS